MKTLCKNALSVVLVLSLFLGSMAGVFATGTEAKKESDPSEIHFFASVGDNLHVPDMASTETALALTALAESYAALGITRVYWRGLQMSLWTDHDVLVDEALPAFYLSVAEQDARFEEKYGMSWDAYFVKEAHKLGIEVYGVSTLEDWGSAPDVPVYSWPMAHNADFRIENPDWIPKDKYGLIEQGGAINFSYPLARKYFVDMHMEEINDAGYDGLMFLTYSENYSVMFGDQFGYDSITVRAFKSRYGIDPTTDAFTQAASLTDWRALRGEYVTALFREFDKALGDKKFAIWLDGTTPYYMNIWTQESHSNRNMIFLDLNTYIQKNIFDTFIVRSSTSNRRTARRTIDDLYFLTRGYDIEIAVDTSSPYSADWDEFRARDLDFMYNSGAFGEEYMYNGLELADGATEEHKTNKWLGQIAMGTTRANIPQVTKYLTNDTPYTTLRLAIKAITKLAPGNLADLIEPFLAHKEPGIRSAAAISLRGKCDEDSIDYLIDALDKYNEFTLYYAVQRTLQTNVKVYADKLLDLAENHENPRVRAVAMYALSNNTHNLKFPDALDMFADAVETEFAPAKADEQIKNEYNSIRAYATVCIGNIRSDDAIDTLIEISKNGDTVVNFRAAQCLGNYSSYFLNKPADASKKQSVIDALAALLETMGVESTRADRDWAYRPISDALLAYGADGKAVLEKNLDRTDDFQLALFAWKALYIPYKLSTWVSMNEESYEEAYQNLPNVLKKFNHVVLEQNFDNTDIFDVDHKKANQNGCIRSDTKGNISNAWGIFSKTNLQKNTYITTDEHHSGNQCIVQHADTIVTVGTSWSGTYEFSYWIKRASGAAYSFWIMDPARNPEVDMKVTGDGKITILDAASSSYIDTGLTIPANEWTQVTVTVDTAAKMLSFRTANDDGEIRYAVDFFAFTPIEGSDRILFRSSGYAELFLDDFYLALPTIEPYTRPD